MVVTRISAFFNRTSPTELPVSSYSVSSLGLNLLYEVLERQELAVKRVASNHPIPLTNRQLIVLSSPVLSTAFNQDLSKVNNLLVILPKYAYVLDEAKPQWIRRGVKTAFTHLAEVFKRLNLPIEGEVALAPEVTAWNPNFKGQSPTIQGLTQLIKSPDITPIIGSSSGLLLGVVTVGPRKVYFLADPDLLNNHGLIKGQNLDLAQSIFADLLPPSGEIIFDEPRPRGGDLPRDREAYPEKAELFSFPTLTSVLIFFQVVLTGFLAFLAGASRLGPPVKDETEVSFGRKQLIQSGARLLSRRGLMKSVTQDYVNLALRAAAKAAHLPKGLNDKAIKEILAQKDLKFSLTRLLATIERTADPSEKTCLSWAKTIYSFKVRLERGSEAGRRYN
jgi:hypothetical protein